MFRKVLRPAIAVVAVIAAASLVVACSSSSSKDGHTTQSANAGKTSGAGALNSMLPAAIRSAGVIRTGGPVNNPPLVYTGTSGGAAQGVVIDLANAMGKELGVRITYASMPFPGLLPALSANKIDMIMSVMSDTASREKTLDFVDFLKDGLGMLVAKGNPDHVNDLPDLCGRAAGVLQGSLAVALVQTTSEQCTSNGKRAIDVKQFSEHSDAVVALQSGKVAAVFTGIAQGKYTAKTAGNGSLFEMSPGGPYLPSPFGIAVPKAQTQLRDALQAALQAMVADGTYAQILGNAGLSEGAYTTIPVNGASSS